ncbi:hypothetical protein GA0115239_10131, partial [Streptomyces sp. BpilaLS-43]
PPSPPARPRRPPGRPAPPRHGAPGRASHGHAASHGPRLAYGRSAADLRHAHRLCGGPRSGLHRHPRPVPQYVRPLTRCHRTRSAVENGRPGSSRAGASVGPVYDQPLRTAPSRTDCPFGAVADRRALHRLHEGPAVRPARPRHVVASGDVDHSASVLPEAGADGARGGIDRFGVVASGRWGRPACSDRGRSGRPWADVLLPRSLGDEVLTGRRPPTEAGPVRPSRPPTSTVVPRWTSAECGSPG